MFPAYGIPNVNALVCERDQDLEVDDHYRGSVTFASIIFTNTTFRSYLYCNVLNNESD